MFNILGISIAMQAALFFIANLIALVLITKKIRMSYLYIAFLYMASMFAVIFLIRIDPRLSSLITEPIGGGIIPIAMTLFLWIIIIYFAFLKAPHYILQKTVNHIITPKDISNVVPTTFIIIVAVLGIAFISRL